MTIYIKYLTLYIIIHFISFFLSRQFNLTDKPNNRKIHSNKIPYASGIAIYFFLIVLTQYHNIEIKIIIYFSSLMLLIGLIDDIFELKPLVKIFLISIPIILLINQGYNLDSLGQYEYFGDLKLGKYSFFFTYLCIALLINAYNYNDGIDGLGISQLIIPLFYFIFLLEKSNQNNFALNILSMCLIFTFFFNINNNPFYKSFLGNSGSLFIGYLLSFLIIHLYVVNNIHPAYLIWSVAYLVYEFLTVTILRLMNKKKLFKPSQDHFHHLIFYYFNRSHIYTTNLISIISLLFIASGYFVVEFFGFTYSLFLYLIIFIFYFFFRLYLNKSLSKSE